jgi:chromosome segregation ATPase
LQAKYQRSLTSDSGVVELSILLSECDSLRDRLDSMTSSFHHIETRSHPHQRTASPNQSLARSPSSQNQRLEIALLQTKDEYERLLQTLRSSKQIYECKEKRLHTIRLQYNDLKEEYHQLSQSCTAMHNDHQYPRHQIQVSDVW